ncbi:hypothetical protein PQQ84_22650 [Paraburkholderia strydomiana]|uniref:hypothetical protein n=1 Tax=Paraburkholderia strydomiana TaxID=1245417 RepID=UPI0038BAF27D
MAARLRKTHQEEVRTKIQVSQLLNVLQNHALGTLEELAPTRLRAIEILLKKTLPDLSQTELTGADGGPIQIERVRLKMSPVEELPE